MSVWTSGLSVPACQSNYRLDSLPRGAVLHGQSPRCDSFKESAISPRETPQLLNERHLSWRELRSTLRQDSSPNRHDLPGAGILRNRERHIQPSS
jgi:hypothetical protein